MDLLEVDSVIKSFGDRQLLTDIYLRCSTGDIIGLFGRNGIGKSTLLKIIFGTLNANNKFVRINDKILDNAFKFPNLIQYLPQDNFLPNNITVRQVIKLYFDNDELLLNDDILLKVADTKISALSGGEERYLEIKLLLFSNAKFVLLDEPFNGVAPILIDLIKDMIKEQSNNKGIIITDHDFRNVLDVANKYILMFDGGIKKIDNKTDLEYWGYLPEKNKKSYCGQQAVIRHRGIRGTIISTSRW